MSGSDPGPRSHCYRHPDRESYVLCQRCGRTICPECQTPAAVGFHCPECMRESRASAPRTRPTLLRTARRVRGSDGPVATYSLIGVTFAVFVLQLLVPGVTSDLAYRPVFTASEPWTLLTSVFTHSTSSFLHILFNMLSLWVFGRILEQALGRWRFLALYLLAGLGGSVAVLLLSPLGGVLGASGAIFGLMGAFFVIHRGMGGNGSQLLVIVGINLLIGFVVPGVSWQAHVGGLVVGALVGLVLVRTRNRRQRATQVLLLAAILVGLAATTVFGFARLVDLYS